MKYVSLISCFYREKTGRVHLATCLSPLTSQWWRPDLSLDSVHLTTSLFIWTHSKRQTLFEALACVAMNETHILPLRHLCSGGRTDYRKIKKILWVSCGKFKYCKIAKGDLDLAILYGIGKESLLGDTWTETLTRWDSESYASGRQERGWHAEAHHVEVSIGGAESIGDVEIGRR